MSEERRTFGPGDIVVGDMAWGVGAWLPHPVIRVNKQSITVGIHRDPGSPGGWLTTEVLKWADIRGVQYAVPGSHSGREYWLNATANAVRDGRADWAQRQALAALLLLVGTDPTQKAQVKATVANVISEFERTWLAGES